MALYRRQIQATQAKDEVDAQKVTTRRCDNLFAGVARAFGYPRPVTPEQVSCIPSIYRRIPLRNAFATASDLECTCSFS
jgi:hypothetical protein